MAPPKGHPHYDGTKIDIKELERLSHLHLTTNELAEWFGCHRTTLDREPYLSIIQRGRAETKQRLKQKAIQRALEDNSDTMLIFSLKNYCKWGDNGPTDGDGKPAPIQIEFIDGNK